MDVSQLIKAKSNQLNGDDLISGPITVQILAVTKGNSEQPVNIRISGGHMTFRPSKTVLRVLVAAWGTESDRWANRWMTLYRDDSVLWAGEAVGGIRISAMSDIPGPLNLSVAVSNKKKGAQKVAVLRGKDAQQSGAPTANLDALLADHELTRADVDRWRREQGKDPLDTLLPDQLATFAAWLAGDPKRLDAIRALANEAAEAQAAANAASQPTERQP